MPFALGSCFLLCLILKVERTFKSQGYVIGFGGCLVMNTCILFGEKKNARLCWNTCAYTVRTRGNFVCESHVYGFVRTCHLPSYIANALCEVLIDPVAEHG